MLPLELRLQDTMGAKMITKLILENNLICNLRNKKKSRKIKMLSGLVMVIMKIRNYSRSMVILNYKKRKTRQPQSYLSSLIFHLVSSLLFSRVPSCLLLSLVLPSLVTPLLLSRPSSCLLLFSLSLPVCLSPCVVVCCSVLLWCVWWWCVVVCVVVCVVQITVDTCVSILVRA